MKPSGKSLGQVLAFLAACLAACLWSRPTRATAPAGRFTIGAAGAGTVTDAKTGRIWQQIVSSLHYTWAEAKTYCSGNTPGLPGAGWRLPTIRELQSIVDDRNVSPAIDTTAFPSTPADKFWSATPYAGSSSGAWNVNFFEGISTSGDVFGTYYVRCVR
jgi:hypothetical protein